MYGYPNNLGNIKAFWQTVTVKDGAGNTLAQTTNCFDEGTPGTGTTCAATGAPVATSGTPQHVGAPGSSRGNLTSVINLIQGTSTLRKTNTYFDTGNVDIAKDVNGAQTSYTYGDCGNSFPTLVTEPLGLSRSIAWNCTGGVKTSDTDENGQPTTITYDDPNFWRPTSLTDPAGAVTNTCYGAVSSGTCTLNATQIENTLSFNSGNSAVDVLKTVDSQGRPLLSQIRQAPSSTNFDSSENCYDVLGRGVGSTLPYSGTAGQSTTTGCSPKTTYDALGRSTQVSDNGGGLTTFTYTKNDVLVSVGPAPNGENTKRRQFEYDGLGRLASVCELTSGSGSGTCGQALNQTGYWTQYTYDALGNLTGVTQNAQSTTTQARTFTYDGLSRLTSEINPESGTTQYFYDAAPSTPGVACTGPFNGDLVKRFDANGNTICKTYDAFHRVLSTTYSGPNATTTNRYFLYDSATVNSQTMANAKTQIAEAYTATCSTCTKVTDEGFSYSTRGELANFYESTPNSGGYYSVPVTYWENGLPKTFGPFLGISQEGFTPDGEGRFNAMSDGFLQSTTYNTAGQPTQLMTSCHSGTCYPISYSYDPNTLRMKQYSSVVVNNSVNSTISGTLTWNADGSLGQLAVSNPLNASDNQTCSYNSDDLGRIASVNCGSIWTQTFGYDPFGNITKSGSISWMPGYNSTTNRYSLSGTSYDSNGNVLYDTFDRTTWDAEGKPLTTVLNNNSGENWAFTYDAFGHKAELAIGGTYNNSYITLGAFKLAAKGQAGATGEFPLPGGSTRTFGGGATGFNLADWLGTSRVFYTYTGAGYSQSGARAPFGEPYAFNAGYPGNFTGQGDDAVGIFNGTSDLTYYFPERHYRGPQGRWASPDPAGLSAVDPTDPQSWNRYAYVQNRPLTNVDPFGLDDGSGDDGGDDGGDWGGWDGNFGESLGFPTGIAIVGPAPSTFSQCDFFACGTGSNGANGFISNDGTPVSGTGDPGDPYTFVDQVWAPFLPDPTNNSARQLRDKCFMEKMSKYSLAGIADAALGTNFSDTFLGNLALGNDITGLASVLTPADPTGSLASVVGQSVENGVEYGIGTPLRIGGNTAPAFQTLFPRLGRPAQALLRAKGLSKALKVFDILDGKLEIDAALALAWEFSCPW